MAENESTVTTDETADVVTDEVVETEAETQKPDVPVEVKRALAKANKEAETLRLKLKDFEDRDKTDAQKLLESRDAAESRASKAEQDLARMEVAAEKGLTPAQAKRLIGATREELEADADELITTFPKAKPVYGDVGQGARGENGTQVFTRKQIANPVFFQKNRADILAALNAGLIEE